MSSAGNRDAQPLEALAHRIRDEREHRPKASPRACNATLVACHRLSSANPASREERDFLAAVSFRTRL